MHFRLGIVLLLGNVASACANNATSSSSSTGGPAESQLLIAYRTLAVARCAYLERCKEDRGKLHSSEEVCRRLADADFQAARGSYETLDLGYTADPTALAACTSAIAQAACLDAAPLEALKCTGLLKAKTPRAVGAACMSNVTAGAPLCDPPALAYCTTTSAGCGVCAAKAALYAPCSSAEQCQSGYCTGTRCEPGQVAAANETVHCGNDSDCGLPLVCAGPVAARACARRGGDGSACGGDLPKCLEDLFCVEGVCTPRLAVGEGCARSGGTNVCLDRCKFDSPNAATGHCAAVENLPGDGQPCSTLWKGRENTTICASGAGTNLYQASSGAACTCQERVVSGGTCPSESGCVSGICDGFTSTMPGTCVALKANGTTCGAGRYCESGYCNAGTTPPSCAAPNTCQ